MDDRHEPAHQQHDGRAFGRAEVTGVAQERVEIELPPKVGEAVIAHHDDGRAIAIAIHHVADDLIESAV